MSAEMLIARLHNVRSCGPGKWAAGCPLCQSRRGTPIAVSELPNGIVLLHPFCGCETEDVVTALGLSMKDLFPAPLGHHMPPVQRRFDANQVLMALTHEITVLELVTYDVAGDGRLDADQRDRIRTAAWRFSGALLALGNVNDRVRRIRRAGTTP
jgi:hypothetical protein